MQKKTALITGVTGQDGAYLSEFLLKKGYEVCGTSRDAQMAGFHNLKYLGILLSIWFVVSYGCGILLVDMLDQVRIGGFGLGFWFAQQGAIYVFVILIFVYVWLMNRLDRKYDVHED